MRRAVLVLGVCGLFVPARDAVADVRVNTYTTGNQVSPAVAMGPGGDFVVVWQGPQSTAGFDRNVFGRRYGADGLPLGGEFLVSSHTTGDGSHYPSVALQPSGGFVVVWTQPGGVYSRVYDASGAPVGPAAPVNDPGGTHRRGVVATDAAGNFVVAWQGDEDIWARRFDTLGQPLGAPMLVNSYTTDSQRSPAIAVTPTGDFVVVWTDHYYDRSITGVVGRRFDASGAPLGGSFLVNTYTTGRQDDPDVGVAASGAFVVAWDGQDGSGTLARRFDAAGTAEGPEFIVNEVTAASQGRSSVAVGPGGAFLVAWRGENSTTNTLDDVQARHYDAAGQPLGGQFRVNGHADYNQDSMDVASGADGRYAVAWMSFDQDASGWSVFADRLGEDPVFRDGFESGGLSAWTAASTDGGDLAVTPEAALAGTTQGLQAAVDDTAGLYVEDHSPAGESRYRARFYLDPNSFEMGEALGHRRTRVFVAFLENPTRRVIAIVLRNIGGGYELQAHLRLDEADRPTSGSRRLRTPFHPIANAPHWVEFDWRRATEPGAGDGRFDLWVDGFHAWALTGVHNAESVVDFVRLGTLSVKGGASGELRFDEFTSRTQTYIGPSVP
jgi:hypothetical protein